MKYVTPKYENVLIEVKDVITSSTASNKYEIEQEDNGKGNVIMDALNIFR